MHHKADVERKTATKNRNTVGHEINRTGPTVDKTPSVTGLQINSKTVTWNWSIATKFQYLNSL
jgi:hypothetical protein